MGTLFVDSSLTFHSHIDKIVARACIRSNLILKCFVSRDVSTLMRVHVLIHILICIILIVLSVHIVFHIYFCTRIPVSASEPRCSIILVHVICLTFVSTHVYFDNKIQFNSIQLQHFRITFQYFQRILECLQNQKKMLMQHF